MSVRFLHLFPTQLGLNGEVGNLDCLVQRLKWAGIDSSVRVFDGSGSIGSDFDAVFIGSGTLAGALEALELLEAQATKLRDLSDKGTPFLALGLGWEILGESIELVDGRTMAGVGVFPSRSTRVSERASAESYGFDNSGELTTGYANHSAEIELLNDAKALVSLKAGFGNSSRQSAKQRPDEGILDGNLMGARLNGPLLPLNPHLADAFLKLLADRAGFSYEQTSQEAKIADGYAAKARLELKGRLAS
jgi:CobQ-like glutamine amidotransferase family enzyme